MIVALLPNLKMSIYVTFLFDRYSHGGSPVYLTAPPPGGYTPAVCRTCGAPSQYELQLLPSLLTVLKPSQPTGIVTIQ